MISGTEHKRYSAHMHILLLVHAVKTNIWFVITV